MRQNKDVNKGRRKSKVKDFGRKIHGFKKPTIRKKRRRNQIK